MISKRGNYSYLLDNLKYAYKNYKMDEEGYIYNKSGTVNSERRVIINLKFCLLYCLAYRANYEMNSLEPIDNMDNRFIDAALSDYNCFNSFINICINEYKIYDNIGTGNISYVPQESLASYIFQNPDRRRILEDYLNYELVNIFAIETNRGMVKKRV